MKFTIRNFKAIENLRDFKLKPINVLSGENSGGKTSFIQFLLLIKQSLESNGLDTPLILNKPYALLGKFKDILHNQGSFGFKFVFEKSEFSRILIFHMNRLFKRVPEEIHVDVDFVYSTNKIYIQNFSLNYLIDGKDTWVSLERIRGKKYKISLNNNLFLRDNFLEQSKTSSSKINQNEEVNSYWEGNVKFEKFFPTSFEIKNEENVRETIDFSPLVNQVRFMFIKMFEQISYIGPLREEPHTYYFNNDDSDLKIGNKGEHAAYILARYATDEVTHAKINRFNDDEGISYTSDKESLEEAVNYWVCKIFDMAQKIKVNEYRNGTIYEVEITNKLGRKTAITQVGFGLSQILPIVVEGLRLKSGSILILEQPEIHLHPKVQSLLFDFLYSLTLCGKRVIVETHSDHLITRLRRRVAEDIDNELSSKINLLFFESVPKNENVLLDLSNLGNLTYWPVGFFDQHEKDLRAIVKAQNRKRKISRDREE